MKGKLDAQDMTHRRDGEVSTELGADWLRQRKKASEGKVDGLDVYVMVWAIDITYDDQAKDTR